MLTALLWDVDGTLAETEREGHLAAFNRAFAAYDVPWRWDEAHYRRLLPVRGGRDRLLHDLAARPEAPRDETGQRELARSLHAAKCEYFQQIAASGALALRRGVGDLLLDGLLAGMRLGIVSSSSRANVDALLRSVIGAQWQRWFDAVVCGEDSARKKPHAEPYARALAALQLHPWEALAIEDSPEGAAAARAAGVPVVVARSEFFAGADLPSALAAGPCLAACDGWSQPVPAAAGRVGLAQLRSWHSRIVQAGGTVSSMAPA